MASEQSSHFMIFSGLFLEKNQLYMALWKKAVSCMHFGVGMRWIFFGRSEAPLARSITKAEKTMKLGT